MFDKVFDSTHVSHESGNMYYWSSSATLQGHQLKHTCVLSFDISPNALSDTFGRGKTRRRTKQPRGFG